MRVCLIFISFFFAATFGGCGGGGDISSGNDQGHHNSAVVDTPGPYSLRWKPTMGDSWYYQLQGTLDMSAGVSVYDVDLFNTSPQTIESFHNKNTAVVCYFSAGSAENWRPDYVQFLSNDMGYPLKNWVGERWVNTSSGNVRAIMRARLDRALAAGCDGVDPDNVDGYANSTGLPLTADTQLEYNKFLANEAHVRGLAIGLKNDIKQVADLVRYFDFAINEQCFLFGECGSYIPFIAQLKPVVDVEYNAAYVANTGGARDQLCKTTSAEGIYSMIMPLLLDGTFYYICR